MDRNIRVKIFGERHTGTNYLQSVLSQDHRVTCIRGVSKLAPWICRDTTSSSWRSALRESVANVDFTLTQRRNFGWKHREIEPDLVELLRTKPEVKVICMTKDPYAWVASMLRHPYHVKPSVSSSLQFLLEEEWCTQKRESKKRSYPSLIDLWNTKNESYLTISQELPVFLVRYEDLLVNFESKAQDLASFLGLEEFDWRQIEISTKNDGRSYEEIREYYLNRVYLESLSSKDVALINSRLNFDLVRKFNYQKVFSD